MTLCLVSSREWPPLAEKCTTMATDEHTVVLKLSTKVRNLSPIETQTFAPAHQE